TIVLLVLFTIPVLIPFIRSGYFPTHDGEWAVVRLADMYRTVIQDQQIPTRYSGYLNAGYGYPLFNFAYPFPYYIGLLPLALNAGFVGSIKLLFALSIPLSAIVMFFFSKKLWNSTLAGIISAIVYTYAPYRMVDLFVRGSIGESLSFILFPALGFLSLKISEKPMSAKSVVSFSLLFALLIGTHNIMMVLFAPILAIFTVFLILKKNKMSWRSFVFAWLLGIGLSTFFWLPALAEKHLIWLAETPIADRDLYFVSLRQVLIPSWGYAPPTESGGFSYQLGISQVILLLLSLVISGQLLFKKKRTFSHQVVLLFTTITVVTILMMFSITSFVWSSVPLLKEINYPWTMLSQAVWLIALLAGYLASLKTIIKTAGIALAIVAFVLTIPYARPAEYVDRGDDFYLSNDAVTTSSDEYLPLWTKTKPPHRADQKVQVEGEGFVREVTYDSKSISFSAELENESTITINTIYYPGWQLLVRENKIPVTYDNEYGVMQFTLPAGNHQVRGFFRETPIRLLANSITGLSILIMALFVFARPVYSSVLKV
ncbi:hypothetical protein HY469_02835, partial [Candidatus Roizmanbacteria bacterium]|nr:hypothetical protein [Candidatus Roizmanbacteria bacterium]